ncbi:MAG: hypothetical protein WBP16_00585 [Ferruginibacter sp.]
MKDYLKSSAVLVTMLFFIFISCKNSDSGSDTVLDSLAISKKKDSLAAAENKVPKPVFVPSVLKIGQSFDYQNKKMLGSSMFTKKDSMFTYCLLNNKAFGLTDLNLRFYRLLENRSDLLESVTISVDPKGNMLSDSFALNKVYDEFGYGAFEMQFLHKDSVIAAEMFLLQ